MILKITVMIVKNSNCFYSQNRAATVELQWLEHRWLVYHGCFELILESLGKIPFPLDLEYRAIFCLMLKMVYCVHSFRIASMRRF